MRIYLFLACLGLIPVMVWSQSHLNMRLNESGMVKILKLVADYNLRALNSDKIKIPQNLYEFKILASDLAKSPFIGVLQEVSDVRLDKDLPFYLESSDILIRGDINQNSIQTELVSQGAKKIVYKLSLKITKLSLSASELSLCDRKKAKKCSSDALSASLKDVKVSLKPGQSINVSGEFEIDLSGKKLLMKMKSVSTNLSGKNSPQIEISFSQLVVPPVAIIVNNQRTELDTSLLKEKILEKKEFLAKKLLGFASEFMAQDLTELVNKFLRAQNISTEYQVINYQSDYFSELNEQISSNIYRYFPTDNTSVSPSVHASDLRPASSQNIRPVESQMIMDAAMNDFAKVIQMMSVSLGVSKVLVPFKKDLELHLSTAINLNNQNYPVPVTIQNSQTLMAPLDLSAVVNRQEHAQLAISAPLINAALKVVSSTGLVTNTVDLYDDEPGFWVNNAQIHLPAQDNSGELKLHLVANASIKLSALKYETIWQEIENEIGAWLERNNNRGVMYFPLEFQLRPRLVKDANGKIKLLCRIDSPFEETTTFKNTYRYPTNLDVATKKVRDGVIKSLKKRLSGILSKEFNVDLTPFLNQKGITFEPRSLKFVDSSYIVLGLDLIKVDLNKLEGSLE